MLMKGIQNINCGLWFSNYVLLKMNIVVVLLLLFYGLVYVRGMFTKAFKVNLACYTKMSFSACFPNVLLK